MSKGKLGNPTKCLQDNLVRVIVISCLLNLENNRFLSLNY